MVKNKARKVRGAKQLALYFRQIGKVLTQEEYDKRSDQPIRLNVVNKLYRGYAIAIQFVEMVDKTIVEDLKPKPKPKAKPAPAVKKVK
jgi:hypothetical protein